MFALPVWTRKKKKEEKGFYMLVFIQVELTYSRVDVFQFFSFFFFKMIIK